MMESEGVRGGGECRETTSERKWPINLDRNVEEEFTGEGMIPEEEEEEDDVPPHPDARGDEEESGGNRSDGGKGKKERKGGVMSALKIVSPPLRFYRHLGTARTERERECENLV